MCDCIKTTTELLQTRIKDNTENKHKVSEWMEAGSFNNTAFSISGGSTKVYMPFTAVYVRQKKDGTPERRETKVEVNMYASYCPFCGEKHSEE